MAGCVLLPHHTLEVANQADDGSLSGEGTSPHHSPVTSQVQAIRVTCWAPGLISTPASSLGLRNQTDLGQAYGWTPLTRTSLLGETAGMGLHTRM